MSKLLIILIALCAVVVSGSVIDPALTTRHVILALGVLLMFWTCRIDRCALANGIGSSMLIFLAISVGASFRSTNGTESTYEVARLILMLGFFAVAVSVIDRDIAVKYLTYLALFMAIYGLTQFICWQVKDYTGDKLLRCTGTMCNRNLWASSMLLLLPFCIEYRRIGYVAAGLIVTLILCLFARSSVLGLIIILIVYSLHVKRTRAFVFGMLFVIGCVLLFRWEHLSNNESLIQRVEMWKQSVPMLADGYVGPGNWKLHIPLYLSNLPGSSFETFFLRPHNDFVLALCETGIIGLIAYLSIFICALRCAIKKKDAMVSAGIMAYMVFACFSFPRERVFHSVILLVYFALVVPKSGIVLKSKSISLICLVFVTVFMFGRYKSEGYAKSLMNDTADPDMISFYSTFSNMTPMTTPYYWYKGVDEYREQRISAAIASFDKAMKVNPNNLYVLNNLAACLYLNGDKERAEEMFKRALVIDPDNKYLLENIGSVDEPPNNAK